MLGNNLEHLKVLHGHALVTHLATHAHALEHLCGVRAGTDRTWLTQTVILAKELLGSYFTKKMEGTYEIMEGSWKGPELEGIRYEQLIPWVKPEGDAFRVIVGDYVTTSDGTGIVHIAPTFGADDDRVAKAAGIPLVVAINKMDVHGANPDRIKQQLTEYGLVPEEWGGETIVCPISAKTGEGVDNLLENLVLLAEIQELKANPNRAARGTVIEARMDKGRGPIMTVLVQNGTLHQGDIIIAGTAVGRVRTMTNDKGQRVTEAGPSIPVEIAGMSEVPSAGDTFNAVADERMAREVVEQRKQQKKDAANAGSKKVSLDDLFSRIQQGEMKDFNIIVKADVQGSAEAVKSSLEKLSNEEVRVQVIHSGVGAISESDVMLAATSNAIIVGFNVRPDAAARDNAARSNVEIRMYRVIYDCINEIEAAMKGMLAPKFQEQIIGHVEIRQTFKVSKVGTVCGGYVTDGKIVRNSKVRVVRDNIVVFEGDLASLRRFKDDVKEVASGYECGLQVDKYNDIKVGDVIEVFVMQEIKQ